jgi:predicted O-methyltransferase YrrM
LFDGFAPAADLRRRFYIGNQMPEKPPYSSILKADSGLPVNAVRQGRAAAPSPGILQLTYHLGRLGEAMQCGELLLGFLDELVRDEALLEQIEKAVAPVGSWQTKHFQSVFEMRLYRILLYAVIRATKPEVAIETGVLHGLTTAFLLRALELNGKGRLISVDLPSYPAERPANNDGYNAFLPPGMQPGWVVDKARHGKRWDLRMDASTVVLPALGPDSDGLGFFLHDSDHTFKTMWFELDWAWEHLVDGGVLVCDNIEASTAFQEFARRVDRDAMIFPAPDLRTHEAPRFALIVK